MLLSFLSLVKKIIFLNQYSYTHTHIKTANNLIVMPEYDTHDPRNRYAEIEKIIAEIERIHPNIYNLEYEDGRKNAEKHIRRWYAEISICQAVTQRDRIQTAWTRYDYNVVKKAIYATNCNPIEYENPEELV